MNKDLEEQSNKILCANINHLNDLINKENDNLFKKRFIGTSPNMNKPSYENPEGINYLKSSYISKKDCIYTSTEEDFKEWEKIFYDTSAKSSFNISTKPKMNSPEFYESYICP